MTSCCCRRARMRSLVHPDPDWIVGKYALMNLHAKRRNGRTEIDPRSWRIPYQWQGCHYQDHDDQPFLLLINSGGGFVEGDVAELNGEFDPGTRSLLTTTSSSKFYKCLEGRWSKELVNLTLGEGAVLEYCPDETIPFADAKVRRATRIELAPSARLFATDMLSAGRVHYGAGEVFQFSALQSSFEISVDGKPLILDRLRVEGDEVQALTRLWDGALHSATIFAYAPDLPAVEESCEAAMQAAAPVHCGATRMENLIVCRILASDTWQAHAAIYAAWEVLRPLVVGKPARVILKC